MSGGIGRRAALLAASSLVSVAVAIGTGASAAQAVEPTHGPTVKKEKESFTHERVIWFDGKDKKKPHRYGDEAGGAGLSGLDEAVSDATAPVSYQDPQREMKDHNDIKKKKDSVTWEKVVWFGDKDKKKPHGQSYDGDAGPAGATGPATLVDSADAAGPAAYDDSLDAADPAAFAAPAAFDDSVDPAGPAAYDDSLDAADPAAFAAPAAFDDSVDPAGPAAYDDSLDAADPAAFAAPAAFDDSADPAGPATLVDPADAAGPAAPTAPATLVGTALAPTADYGKKDQHKNIEKKKESIRWEKVVWFGNNDNHNGYGDDGGYPGYQDPGATGAGGTDASQPVSYHPDTSKRHKNVIKKKISYTRERVIWFGSKRGYDNDMNSPSTSIAGQAPATTAALVTPSVPATPAQAPAA